MPWYQELSALENLAAASAARSVLKRKLRCAYFDGDEAGCTALMTALEYSLYQDTGLPSSPPEATDCTARCVVVATGDVR